MLVSVIITTYNREYSVLRRAIESVKNQTYSNIELIIVNDTEVENNIYKIITDMIKMDYGDSITYVSSGGKKGACYSRNLGAEVSNGEFIAFLDDDDLWEYNKLELQVEILQSTTYPMVTVGFNTIYMDKNNKKRVSKNKSNKVIKLNDLLEKNVVGGSSAPLIRRTAFFDAGQFDIQMPAAQDYDLWIRICKIGDVFFIGKPLQQYYVYKGERISNNSTKKIIAYKRLLEKYNDLLAENKKSLKNKYVVISFHYFKNDDTKEGKKYLKLAISSGTPTLQFFLYTMKIIVLRMKNILK